MNAPIPGLRAHIEQDKEALFQVSLMDGSLHDGAGMPVLQLLEALRQYHQQRDLSHWERFGEPDPDARKALAELDETRHSLREMSSTLGTEEQDIFVEASLSLRMARSC